MPFTDEELKALAMEQQHAAPSAAALSIGGGSAQQSGFTDQQLKGLAQEQTVVNTKPTNVPKPPTLADQPYDFLQDAGNMITAIQDNYGIGDRQMHDQIRGAQYVFGARDPNEFRKGETRVPLPKQFVKDSLTQHFVDWFSPAVQAIPSMLKTMPSQSEVLQDNPIGSAIVGPAVMTIAESILTAGKLAAGEMYNTLRENDIPHEKAKHAALAMGAFAGVLQGGGLASTGGAGTSAMKAYMQSPVGRKVITGAIQQMVTSTVAKKVAGSAVTRIGVNAATQVGLGTAQSLANAAIKNAVGVHEGKGSLVVKDWVDQFGRSLTDSMKTALPLVGATEGAGAAVGLTARAMQHFASKETPTIEHATEAVAEAVINTQTEAVKTPVSQTGRLSAWEQAIKTQEEADKKATAQAEESIASLQQNRLDRENGGASPLVVQAADAVAQLGNGKKLAKGATKNQPFNVGYQWLKGFGISVVNQEGKMRAAFQDAPNGEALAEKFGTHDATEHANALRRQGYDSMYDHLVNATGLPKDQIVWKIYNAGNTDLTIEHLGRNRDGSISTTTDYMKVADAISYHLWFENKEAQNGLKYGNNFTYKDELPPGADSTQAAIERAISSADPNFNYLLLADGLRSFYKEAGPELANTYERITGKPLDILEGYGGKITRTGMPEAKIDSMTPLLPWENNYDYSNTANNPPPGFTKERSTDFMEIAPKNAFRNVEDYITRKAQWEAMAEPSQLWRELVENPQFQANTKTKFGKGYFASIKNGYLDTIHGTPDINGKHIAWIDKMMQAKLIQTLAFKPLQAVKHWTTITNFALVKYDGKFIPVKDLVGGIYDAGFFNLKDEVKQTLGQWDAYKTRYAAPEHAAMGAITKREENPAILATQQASMKPFVLGDKWALHRGAWAVYQYVLKKTKDPVIAERAASKAFNDVLASGSMSQLSDISRNQLTKLVAQFKQPAIRLFQHTLEATRDAVNRPTKENIANAVRVNAVVHLSMALFVAPEIAFTYAITQDAKRREEAIYHFWREARLGAQLPLIGDMLASADAYTDSAITGQAHKVFEPSAVPFDAAAKSMRLFKHVTQFLTGDRHAAAKEIFEDALNAIQGPGVGAGFAIPVEQPVKAAKDIMTDPTNPFYMGGIFNPGKKEDNE